MISDIIPLLPRNGIIHQRYIIFHGILALLYTAVIKYIIDIIHIL